MLDKCIQYINIQIRVRVLIAGTSNRVIENKSICLAKIEIGRICRMFGD